MSVAWIADKLVSQAMLDHGVKKPEAQKIIANMAGITAGTLENLKRNRLKRLDDVATALNEVVVRQLENKAAEIEIELAIARAARGRVAQVDIRAAEAALDEAKKHLGRS